MQVSSSPLLPILRSKVQGELLAIILLNPDKEYSVQELQRIVGYSDLSNISREVKRLAESGFIATRKLGRTTAVRSIGPSNPTINALTELISLTFGPKHVVEVVLGKAVEEGIQIEEAYIVGSWAARYKNKKGPIPQDLDIVIVTEQSHSDFYPYRKEIEKKVMREVQTIVISPKKWNDKESTESFILTVKESPHVKVL